MATIEERRARAAARRKRSGKPAREQTVGEKKREIRQHRQDAIIEDEDSYIGNRRITNENQRSLKRFTSRNRRR
jgi:hypothetical protein